MSHHSTTATQPSSSTSTSSTSSVTPSVSDNNNNTNNENVPSSTSFSLAHLPQDVLLQICDRIDSRSLRALSQTSRQWHAFCNDDLWARRIATLLGVHQFRLASVHVKSSTFDDDDSNDNNKYKDQFYNILQRLEQCKYSNKRYICVHLQPSDSLSGLSLRYAISRDDLCRANNLYAERQLAARQFIYVPVSAASSHSLPPHHRHDGHDDDHGDHDDERNKKECDRDKKQYEHITIVRDVGLSNKLFPVVACHHQHQAFTDWYQSHDNNTHLDDNANNGSGGECRVMHSHDHSQQRRHHVHNPSMSLRIFRAPLSHYRVSFTTVVRGRHIRNP